MRAPTGLGQSLKPKPLVIDNLNEQSKDICIWFFAGGVSKVLDKYASQAVQPADSFEAYRFLHQQAETTKDENMQEAVEALAVRLFYMHAPEEVVTPQGLLPTPLASHKLYKQ